MRIDAPALKILSTATVRAIAFLGERTADALRVEGGAQRQPAGQNRSANQASDAANINADDPQFVDRYFASLKGTSRTETFQKLGCRLQRRSDWKSLPAGW